MDGFIDASLEDTMPIGKPKVKKVKDVSGLKKNIDPKTNHFIFERTAAGEKVRTLVEMKGDEIIRQGVDAAYSYLNGRRAGLVPKSVEGSTLNSRQPKSLFSALWPFILGVGLTLFFISEMLPGGLTALFNH